MSVPIDPFSGLVKRQEMQGASFSHSPPMSSSQLLAAATTVKGILEAADAERAYALLSRQGTDHRDDADGCHGGEEDKEGQWRRQAPQGSVDPQRASLLPHHGQTPRRPVRTFRKRGRYVVHSSDDGHMNTSDRVNVMQLDAVAAAAAALSSAAAASGVGTFYARQAAINSSSSSLSAAPPRQNRQRPSFPPAASLASSATRLLSSETYLRRLFVTSALAHVLSLDACLPRTMHAQREASARVSLRGAFGRERGWHGREEAGRCGGQQNGDVEGGNVVPAGVNNNDDVERGNVTAAVMNKNDDAQRGNVAAAGMNKNDDVQRGNDAAAGMNKNDDVQRGNVAAAGIKNNDSVQRVNVTAAGINKNDDSDKVNDESDENEKPLNAADEAENSAQFTKIFPVTLIDSAGQRWNVKYVTTRRDNLHSGRLADGWEKFCRANRLRVGDSVKFTRLEAHELSFYGLEHGKEAVARVVACKKRL